MCNRFRNNKDWVAVEREFSATQITLLPPKRAKPNRGVIGDIRPTDPAYVVRPGGLTEILPWGFRSAHGPVINFRSEGRRFPLDQRGLVPVTGFYETTPSADPKQKRKDWWLIESDQPIALAAVIRDDRFSLLRKPLLGVRWQPAQDIEQITAGLAIKGSDSCPFPPETDRQFN